MNSSSCTSSHEDRSFLEGLNKEKAALLAPAIFYTVLLMIVGIVGNPIAIFIYGWRWQNTTTRIFLFWLACLDLLNCVVTMPTEIYVLTSFYYFPNEGFCRLSRCFTYVINNSTSAIFLAIAWDRYIRICYPHRKAMTLFRSKVACVVSLFIGVAVSWPALFLYGRKVVPLPRRGNQLKPATVVVLGGGDDNSHGGGNINGSSGDGGSSSSSSSIRFGISNNSSSSSSGSSSSNSFAEVIFSSSGSSSSGSGGGSSSIGESCTSGSSNSHSNSDVMGIICDIRNEMDETPFPLAFFIYLWCAVCMCVLVLAFFYILIGRVILKRRRQKKLKKEASTSHKQSAEGAGSESPPHAPNKTTPLLLPRSQSDSGLVDHFNLTSHLQPPPNSNCSSKQIIQTTVELTKDNRTYVTAAPVRPRSRSNSECAVDSTTCVDFPHFRLSGRRIRPPKSTLMLFAITAVFVLSFLPFLIITIIRQNKGPTFYPSLTSWQEVVVNIFLRFYLLNNCSNPIVYGLCNSQFRRELKKMFRVPLLRRESSMSRGESANGLNGGGAPY